MPANFNELEKLYALCKEYEEGGVFDQKSLPDCIIGIAIRDVLRLGGGHTIANYEKVARHYGIDMSDVLLIANVCESLVGVRHYFNIKFGVSTK